MIKQNEILENFSTNKNHVSKKEKIGFLLGLSGQNIVYSLIGGSFFFIFFN